MYLILNRTLRYIGIISLYVIIQSKVARCNLKSSDYILQPCLQLNLDHCITCAGQLLLLCSCNSWLCFTLKRRHNYFVVNIWVHVTTKCEIQTKARGKYLFQNRSDRRDPNMANLELDMQRFPKRAQMVAIFFQSGTKRKMLISLFG